MEYQNATSTYINGGSVSGSLTQPNVAMSPLDELQKALSVIAERVSASGQRVKNVANNLIGAQPENELKSGGVSGVVDGRLNSLNDQARAIHQLLSDLERQLDRLNIFT
jgi:hypothetical protein